MIQIPALLSILLIAFQPGTDSFVVDRTVLTRSSRPVQAVPHRPLRPSVRPRVAGALLLALIS